MALGGGLARLLLQHQVHSLKRILTTFSRVLDTFKMDSENATFNIARLRSEERRVGKECLE